MERSLFREEKEELARSTKKVKNVSHAGFGLASPNRDGVPWNLNTSFRDNLLVEIPGAFAQAKALRMEWMIDGDQGIASKDLVQVPIGSVTRAQAKKFKDVLNRLIQELWAQANLWRPIEHDPRGQQKIVTLIQVLEGSGQDYELARNILGLF